MLEREKALFSNLKVEPFKVDHRTAYMRSPNGDKDVAFAMGEQLWSIKCGDLWYDYAYQTAEYARFCLNNLLDPSHKWTFAGLMQQRFRRETPTRVARPRIGMK